jgi:hypothetical protein
MIGKSARAAFGSTMRIRGVSSAGRAPALQAGGHRFDPGTLHHPQRACLSRLRCCGRRLGRSALWPEHGLNARTRPKAPTDVLSEKVPQTKVTPMRLSLARRGRTDRGDRRLPPNRGRARTGVRSGRVDGASAPPRDERHRRGRGSRNARPREGARRREPHPLRPGRPLWVGAGPPLRRGLLQLLDLTRAAGPLRRLLVARRGLPPADGARLLFRRRLRTSDELIEGESSSSTIRRRLNDGSAYRAVKVPHRPADLEDRLRRLGWQVTVTATSGPCYRGQGTPARSSAGQGNPEDRSRPESPAAHDKSGCTLSTAWQGGRHLRDVRAVCSIHFVLSSSIRNTSS